MNKQIKEVTLYIQAKKWHFEEGFEIKVDTYQSKSDESRVVIDLDTVVVNVEIPELDEKTLVLAEVEQLQVAIKAEKAASYLRVTSLREKINSLMCLENKSEQ